MHSVSKGTHSWVGFMVKPPEPGTCVPSTQLEKLLGSPNACSVHGDTRVKYNIHHNDCMVNLGLIKYLKPKNTCFLTFLHQVGPFLFVRLF